jgi:hypothetical protein
MSDGIECFQRNIMNDLLFSTGDYSGSITVCKLEASGVKFITTLKVSITVRIAFKKICICAT